MDSETSSSFLRKNLPSRILHVFIAFVLLVALVLSVTSIGEFAPTYEEISEDSIYGDDSEGIKFLRDFLNVKGTCILFATAVKSEPLPPGPRGGGRIKTPSLSSEHVCEYALWGVAVVGFVALLLCGMSVLKAVIGIKM